MSLLNRIQINSPERGINLVCLAITAAAPALAIGPIIGIPTGAVAALGLLAVMAGQQSTNAAERRQASVGAWIIRAFVLCFEQMAYQDAMSGRTSLPFGFGPVAWSWAAVCFMAVLDLWAYSRAAARAEAKAEADAELASFARMEVQQEKERQEREAAAERNTRERLELARIKAQADTEKTRLEAERKRLELQAEQERKRLEAERNKEEAERKRLELQAEQQRKQEEAERNEAERKREKWRMAKARNKGNRPEAELSISSPSPN